jgi:CubicO group peptidase (beta-lactamase class C family)
MLVLKRDSAEQTRFAEILAGFGAADLKDAVVIHDDGIVADWHIEGQDRVNYIFSCTKSFLSALIGIALDQGLIPALDQPIVAYFPELPRLNPDGRFQTVTIRHLLSMTSGIDWPPMDRGKGMYNQMVRSEDWVAFVLKRPLAYQPGAHFNYCDGGSHLLSAILSRATGMSALAFAERYLFPPLGIAKARWKAGQGINLGGTGLHVRTIDMAMLGYLYLSNGSLGDEQVVSQAWVQESTRIHAEGHPEWFGGYGFHWWVSPQAHNQHEDMFFALGQHGQYILCVPAKKLVAAFRKKPGRKQDVVLPRDILFDRVLPCF